MPYLHLCLCSQRQTVTDGGGFLQSAWRSLRRLGLFLREKNPVHEFTLQCWRSCKRLALLSHVQRSSSRRSWRNAALLVTMGCGDKCP